MALDDVNAPGFDHETILEALIRHLLNSDELAQLCLDADTAILIDGDGDPIFVRSADTYANAGVMTHDRGVYVELSDGSSLNVTIGVSVRGSDDTTVSPPSIDDQQRHVP